MSGSRKSVELLAPAGNFEKLAIAIHYGADAVYLAGKDFSLRSQSGNFTDAELPEAVRYAHDRGIRVYLAVNIYPRNGELKGLESFLDIVETAGPDAVIVADPGVFSMVRQRLPRLPVHVSTQANTANVAAARFWNDLGATRINAARELALEEIEEIAARSGLEVEVFVHGAMCIAISGRCLLSSFMAGRESNRGLCAHPCRWQYAVMEQTRQGQFMPITEDQRGTYVFNSKDLCMIGHLPDVIRTGVRSLKIEGRMKGIHYLATVVRVYRQALDACLADPGRYRVEPHWLKELAAVDSRGYCTGFFFGDPGQVQPNYHPLQAEKSQRFLAKVLEQDNTGGTWVQVRNKIFCGHDVEILTPKGPVRSDRIEAIADPQGLELDFAQPGARVRLTLKSPASPNDLIRRGSGAKLAYDSKRVPR